MLVGKRAKREELVLIPQDDDNAGTDFSSAMTIIGRNDRRRSRSKDDMELVPFHAAVVAVVDNPRTAVRAKSRLEDENIMVMNGKINWMGYCVTKVQANDFV